VRLPLSPDPYNRRMPPPAPDRKKWRLNRDLLLIAGPSALLVIGAFASARSFASARRPRRRGRRAPEAPSSPCRREPASRVLKSAWIGTRPGS
jgi:hypothetical protein